MFQALSLGSRL